MCKRCCMYVSVVTHMNTMNSSHLFLTQKCSLYKCAQMKSKGCCYYVVMNFCASAHTVDSSFSNQKEKQNKTCSGLAVSQLYCCMLVNLKYACGKLAKATCERCIFLQQHKVSLMEWVSWHLEVPPVILLNCPFGIQPKTKA